MTQKERNAIYFGRMPLFFLGLAFVLGIYLLLNKECFLTVLLAVVSSFFLFPLRQVIYVIISFLCGIGWSYMTIRYPPCPSSTEGVMRAELSNLVPYQMHKKTMFRCDLFVHSFQSEDGEEYARHVQAVMFTKAPCPVKGGEIILCKACLRHTTPFCLQVIHPRELVIAPMKGTSLVAWRAALKDRLTEKLASLCHDEEVTSLLGTMCFSLPCNQEVRRLIHKVGLDHILGVSGIHFGQLALLVALGAGFLHRWAFSLLTWMLLALFFLLVGPQPSVFRAWIASTLCVGQRVFCRQVYGLNSFGVGLIILALYDPGSLTTLSLQLSFLATGALLTWYEPLRKLVERWLPHHVIHELWHFSFSDQVLAFLLGFAKRAFVLVLAITLFMIPYQLAFLPDLPLMGLVVNLFLPIFFDIALLGTFFILAFSFLLPPLGTIVGPVLEGYVQALLNIVRTMPIPSWSLVQNVHVSGTLVSLYLVFMLLFGVILRLNGEYDHSESVDRSLLSI